MSYIPNIQGLRFVERDGKKILQQFVLAIDDSGKYYGASPPYNWEDVPLELEDGKV